MKPSTINQLLDAAIEMVNGLVSFLSENLGPLLDAAIEIIMSLVDYILDPNNIGKLVETALQIVVTIAGGLVGAAGELVKAAIDLIGQLIGKFNETDWGEIGRNILDGIKIGIENAWDNLAEWFKGLFGDLIDIAKKILGIASPSKVFKKLGFWTAEGFGVGFDDEFAKVKDDMEKAMKFDDASIGINASINKYNGKGKSFGSKTGGVSIVQNIYSEAKTAADLMQEALYHQERAVYMGV